MRRGLTGERLEMLCVDGGLCNLAVQHGEVLAEAVELAQVPRDRRALVVGEDLACEPRPAGSIEQLGVRARRDQVCGAWVSFFTRRRVT